ncbi:MAG: hypothetical protein GY820_04930 [Gammaproteobacteria bacterium]|nr:hypothetical protein [Gammaproteobacteria bacterium]
MTESKLKKLRVGMDSLLARLTAESQSHRVTQSPHDSLDSELAWIRYLPV